MGDGAENAEFGRFAFAAHFQPVLDRNLGVAAVGTVGAEGGRADTADRVGVRFGLRGELRFVLLALLLALVSCVLAFPLASPGVPLGVLRNSWHN